MRFTNIIAAAAAAFAVAVSAAGATTIAFTEPQFPGSGTPAGNEYAASGVTFQSAYYYTDGRDTFDRQGVANGVLGTGQTVGRVNFTSPTGSVGFDWVNFFGQDTSITVEAFDATNMLLSSFTSGAGVLTGSSSLTGSLISYILFSHGTGLAGYTGLSTLTFNTSEVPIPGAALLFLSGLAALRRKRTV